MNCLYKDNNSHVLLLAFLKHTYEASNATGS